jgi:hypothetical protein
MFFEKIATFLSLSYLCICQHDITDCAAACLATAPKTLFRGVRRGELRSPISNVKRAHIVRPFYVANTIAQNQQNAEPNKL